MAELSPSRRRMIEDVTVRDLSPATQRSYITPFRSSAAISVGHRIGLILRMFTPSRFIWSRQGLSWASLNQIVCAR